MNLIDLPNRPVVPAPWAEGDNIPWSEPDFSERMLKEHLSQEHDAASRRAAKIDQQVNWIHNHLLGGRTTSVLDLGCGPGLYTSRLAALGHSCTGIDFSPASIRYARKQARQGGLHCTYYAEDLRSAYFGSGYGMVTLIYGEFNVFLTEAAHDILQRAWQALAPRGALLLEVSVPDSISYRGNRPPTWYSSQNGLFSSRPHIVLEENHWDEASRTTTTRYYAVDAASAGVSGYAVTYQAYTPDEYVALLQECRFHDVMLYPSLIGVQDDSQSDYMVVVARRPA